MKHPIWIDRRDVLALHEVLLALHGGMAGLRDDTLLESALARAQQIWAYGSKPNKIHMATAYTAGIVRNHPFFDGNKRAALGACLVVLRLNGLEPVADGTRWEELTLGITAGQFDREQATERLRELVKMP